VPINSKRMTRRFKFLGVNRGGETPKLIRQYSTPTNIRLTAAQRRTITEVGHIWKTGDRYYKLAERYYGRPQYWWAIALYNNKPTEGHVKLGDTIVIPLPLEKYLRYL
jgi:nucleoid-associated protein YgaU|tara:strand:+ start:740 stop:1063 length:324 start_codon:yes stop_codon:yes gene_type:complete